MSLSKQELSRYASFVERYLEHYIPTTITHYGDDLRKRQMHNFVLQWGKRLRPALAMMMADELDYPSSESVGVFAALEVFHDYLLVHDDIIDQDEIRWNSPTLHKAMQSNLSDHDIDDRQHFGYAQAMIGGDVLYSICQDMILDSDIKSSRKIVLLKILTQTMQHVARGRYKQFLSDYIPLSQISLEYIIEHNLINVTSSYTFLFPLQFGQAVAIGEAEISPVLREFANNLGILFQTGDDIIGLFGDPTITGKSAHGDIVQGKKTIPIYLAYQNAIESDQVFLHEKLWKKDISDADITRVKQIVTDYGLEPTKQFMAGYAQRCHKNLASLPYSDHWKRIFADLIEYLVTREF
jgi:geranylgeranyl diphosphate synthase type I